MILLNRGLWSTVINWWLLLVFLSLWIGALVDALVGVGPWWQQPVFP